MGSRQLCELSPPPGRGLDLRAADWKIGAFFPASPPLMLPPFPSDEENRDLCVVVLPRFPQ